MRNKYVIAIVAVLFSLSRTFVHSQGTESTSLNKKGFSFYKKKEYRKAIESFSKAIEKDPTNFIANYNLACTYAILTTLNKSCNKNYYVKTILALENCSKLDSLKTKQKADNDTDFNGIRNEYEFNVLINNLNFKNPEHIRSFITERTYRSSSPGSIYYPTNELVLNQDDSWLYSFCNTPDAASMELMNFLEKNGTIDGFKYSKDIVFSSKKGKWKLSKNILILIDNTGIEFKRYYLKSPSEIGDLFYPNPNDESGESEVRHYWKCGICGCEPIKGLKSI